MTRLVRTSWLIYFSKLKFAFCDVPKMSIRVALTHSYENFIKEKVSLQLMFQTLAAATLLLQLNREPGYLVYIHYDGAVQT